MFKLSVYLDIADRLELMLMHALCILGTGNMKIADLDSTAMNPNFRKSVMSMTCYMSWSSPFSDKPIIALAEKLTAGFIKHGNGTYFNEGSAYLPDWKRAYWGDHYDRLLAIKRKWDPENVLTCFQCVGSDTIMQEVTTPPIPDIHIPSIIG